MDVEPEPPVPPADHFTLIDLELFHHFVTETAVMTTEDSLSPWFTEVPKMAVKHPYLMHELIAVAALHKAQTDKSRPYARLATEHQAQALPLFREELAAHNAENASALFAFSALFTRYTFAFAPDTRTILFNEDPPGPPNWVFPIRGASALVKQHLDAISQGPMRSFLALHPTREQRTTYEAHFDDLKAHLTVPPGDEDIYERALGELRICFAESESDSDQKNKRGSSI